MGIHKLTSFISITFTDSPYASLSPSDTAKIVTISGQNQSNEGINPFKRSFPYLTPPGSTAEHQVKSSELLATLARLLLAPFTFLLCTTPLVLHPCSNLFSIIFLPNIYLRPFIPVSFSAP